MSIFSRHAYPSDLSDPKWNRLARLLPSDHSRGRRRSTDLREILNAINYRWQTRCAWRMLPHDLPPWQTVYTYYRDWEVAGLMPKIRAALVTDGFEPIGLDDAGTPADARFRAHAGYAATFPFDRPSANEQTSNRQHNLSA